MSADRRFGRLLVGTSGWSYAHWTGVVYPPGLPAGQRLARYAQTFTTVEVNATFYRTPSEKTVDVWREVTPAGFVFAVKGTRLVTHIRRLRDVSDAAAAFLDRISRLGGKLEVVLWQLPPSLRRDEALLAEFLQVLEEAAVPGRAVRHAIEFRHDSWLDDRVFSTLAERGVAMVNVSGETLRTVLVPTACFVYARFHGLPLYRGAYDERALEPWARYLREHLAEGRDCYAYFNNDAEGHAPRDALRLLAMTSSLREGKNSVTLSADPRGGEPVSEEIAVGCGRPTGSVVGAAAPDAEKPAEAAKEVAPVSSIMVGRPAPDFVAPAYHKGKFVSFKLSELLGSWVVLCFYPGDFTFV